MLAHILYVEWHIVYKSHCVNFNIWIWQQVPNGWDLVFVKNVWRNYD